MDLRDLLGIVAGSGVEDWTVLFRPTYRHRISSVRKADGTVERLLADEHQVAFCYRPNIAVTMAYGLVEQGSYSLPPSNPFAAENARTLYLDVFLEGRLAHREVVVAVDRQRCLLPMPRDWNPPIAIPSEQYSLIRLIHDLAGPPTDYDSYFSEAGMVQAGGPWP
jgi:hypothetical protein